MKIGDRCFVRGHIDEIRKDTVIIRNAGGYFGTIPSEVITGELPSAQPEHKTGRWTPDNTDYYRTKFICSVCGESEEVPTMGFGYAPMWGYCPNCGAKMEGGEQK